MTRAFPKFLVGLILITAALVGFTFFANGPSGFSLSIPVGYLIAIFLVFFFTTMISAYFTLRGYEKRAQVAVRSVMTSTILKFFVYLGLLGIFGFLARESMRNLSIIFLAFYFFLTLYEKIFLYQSMINRPTSEKNDV